MGLFEVMGETTFRSGRASQDVSNRRFSARRRLKTILPSFLDFAGHFQVLEEKQCEEANTILRVLAQNTDEYLVFSVACRICMAC